MTPCILQLEVWVDTGLRPEDHSDQTLDQIMKSLKAVDEDVDPTWHLKVPVASLAELPLLLDRVQEAITTAKE